MAKVLVVEDEKMLRDAFTILLRAHAYDVDEAVNGQEALDKCQQHSYDLILLDLMMPVMDGMTFLERADIPQRSPDTRVVILSNLSSGTVTFDAEQLGVVRQEVKSDLSTKQLLTLVQDEVGQMS